MDTLLTECAVLSFYMHFEWVAVVWRPKSGEEQGIKRYARPNWEREQRWERWHRRRSAAQQHSSTAAQQTAMLWCSGPCCIWSYPKSLPSAIDGWDSSTITATNAPSTNVSIVMFCTTGGVVFSTDDDYNDDDYDADDVEEEDEGEGPVTERMCCAMTECDGDGLREEKEADGAGMAYKTSWHAGRQQVQLPTKMSTGRRSASACSASFFSMSSCTVHTHTIAVIVEADSNNKHSGTLPKGAMSVMLCSIVRLEKEEESQWSSERWVFNADSKPCTTSRIPLMTLLLSELCSLLKGRWLQIVSFIYDSMWCKHPWHDMTRVCTHVEAMSAQ